MSAAARLLTGILLASGSTASSAMDTAEDRVLRNATRGHDRQADSLGRLETIQHDQARQTDRNRISTQRAALSLRGFDRP